MRQPSSTFLVPDRFKTQEMCIEAVEVDPLELYDVPDNFKTQGTWDDARSSED